MGWTGLIVVFVLATVLLVYPVVMLAVGAFRTAPPGAPGAAWTLQGFVGAYTDPALPETIRNSVILAFVGTILTTALAVFFCWVVARTTTPLRRLVTPIMVLTFAMPTLYFALAWSMVGDKDVGMANKFLSWITATDLHPVNINSWWGIILVGTLKGTSASYILLIGPFRALDRSLEEASLTSGAGRLKTLWRIDMPVIGPALTGVMILGFVVGLGQLDVPLILGTPAHITFFATEIYNLLNNGAVPQYAPATAISLLLVGVIVVLVAIQRRALRDRQFATVTGRGYRPEPWDIGRWKYACAAAIAGYGLLALVLPIGQLIYGSFQPVYGLYGRFTLDNYHEIFSEYAVVSALKGTATVSILGGLIAMIIVVVLEYLRRRNPGFMMRWVGYATWLPFAMPGLVLGLAISWAYLSIPLVKQLYGTIWIVMIALVVTVVPIAGRVAAGSVTQISQELEDSARMSGASGSRTLVGIIGRLILPSFISGWLLTGLIISGLFDVPLLLSFATNPTMPVVIYNLYSEGKMAAAAAMFSVFLYIIALGMVLIACLRWLTRRLGAPGRSRVVEAGAISVATPVRGADYDQGAAV